MDPERRTPVLMKRFYTAIVRRRRLVLAVFALTAVLSVFAVRQVKVDYDINDYLPPVQTPPAPACGGARWRYKNVSSKQEFSFRIHKKTFISLTGLINVGKRQFMNFDPRMPIF